MNARDLADKAVWNVLLKIKKQELLSDIRDLGKLTYGYPSKEEENILLWLQDEKAIKLDNLSRFPQRRIISEYAMPEQVKLEVVQPAFDKIYKEYDEYFNLPQGNERLLTRQGKKEISDIILTRNIKGMEKKLLHALSGFKPVSFKDLERETGTKSLKALKFSTQDKLKGTGWSIESPKKAGWGGDSFYQLEKLTS